MASDVHYFSPTTPGAASFDEDVSAVVRRGRIGPLSGEAQMGAVGSGSQKLDDIDSTVGHDADGIVGLKQWYHNETTCPAGNQRVYTGYTFDRRYQRADSLVQGVSRQIDVTIMDPNAFLSFRLFAPEDTDPTSSFNRPAEGTLARITALLAVDFLSTTLFDIGYIPVTGGADLDAHDYTSSTPYQVLNDIAQVNGWNYWVGYDETENKLFLWMDDWTTDGTATLAYDSTLKLTNVEAEKSSTQLLVEKWPIETVDPSRVISAVWVMGKGTNVYRTRPETAYTFGWRDAVMQAQFLTDEAKLNALGDRYLLDNSTEDHKISVSVQVPAASVTAIHEGMRIQAHFTHCPSVAADFAWCRILHRTVRRDQETSEFYWLDLDLSPIPNPPCPDPLVEDRYPANNGAVSAGTGNVAYARAGSPDFGFDANPGYDGGGWNFALYNQDRPGDLPDLAGYDLGGTCVTNELVCLGLVGDGTIEIQTIFSSGSNTHLTAWLEHYDSVGGVAVVDETQEDIVPGSVITFNVSSHDGTFCTHRVRVRDTDPAGCGNGWGFAYFDWTQS